MPSLRNAALAAAALVVVLTAVHWPRDVDPVSTGNEWLERPDYRAFYGVDDHAGAAQPAASLSAAMPRTSPETSPEADSVRRFVRQHGLESARVLEVGAGTGGLQDVVADYVGLDISSQVRAHFHKPFVQASATQMPFPDGAFDAIWTINVLEHVPGPEQALTEMRRVLKDGGLLYLLAAWQCRPWAANGYHVRPYGDFGLGGKFVKLSIPLRESVAFRAVYVFPIRLWRVAASLAGGAPTAFRYTRLTPNYEQYWAADSDAVNSMDPYEAILWFTSRGDEVLSFEGALTPFFVRSGTIVVRIRKP